MSISVLQYDLVVNVFSFTMSAMGAAAAFAMLQRQEVLPRYRVAVVLVALVPLVATYNYYRLFEAWQMAFSVSNGVVTSTGRAFNDTYRSADWLVTVPMLVVALVLVLDLPARQAKLRSLVLGIQAAEMILLGYPGQISTLASTRWLWWGAAMVPFAIIVQQLYGGLASAVAAQPAQVRGLVTLARFVTVLTWCFYPAVYVLPLIGVTGTTAFIATQLGYAGADLAAKVGYGLLIYAIAARKSEIANDGVLRASQPARRAA